MSRHRLCDCLSPTNGSIRNKAAAMAVAFESV